MYVRFTFVFETFQRKNLKKSQNQIPEGFILKSTEKCRKNAENC